VTDILDTLRQAEAASKAARMSKQQKITLLKARGWQTPRTTVGDTAAGFTHRSVQPFRFRCWRISTDRRDHSWSANSIAPSSRWPYAAKDPGGDTQA
jgi:hypothetical protein